jgi:dihydroorotase
MTTILIKNGRVMDPSRKFDKAANVFIEGSKVKYVGARADAAETVIDAKGLCVVPGLIDMHVHLREPGKENEETIASGSAAAVSAGFTTIAAMPNTDPALDTEASAEFVYLQATRTGKANVLPIGAITRGRKGEELSEMGQLARGGAVAFSDDGTCVANAEVLRRGLEYSKMFDKAIIEHCEDKNLAGDGVMNEGLASLKLGLPGMPDVAEELIIYRDITLAELTGGKLHIAHISTEGSVEIIRQAKRRGIRLTCEVAPHHFTLTEDCVKTFDTNYKMNPPLRTRHDIKALLSGLRDGTIDVIASDHAPHSQEAKDVEFSAAPFGCIGMETMLPIVLTELVHKKVLTLHDAIAKLTINPAKVLGIPKGRLATGCDADITLIDLAKQWTIDSGQFKSKSRNCPFNGWKVKGKAVGVIVGGRVVEMNC